MSIHLEWFKKGQNSVLRKNKSGCCCIIADDGETIIESCGAHKQHVDNTRHLLNILAVVHRDGGHYVETHGIEKSVADAMEIISDLVVK